MDVTVGGQSSIIMISPMMVQRSITSVIYLFKILSQQGERTFSEEEEQKLQAALSLDKRGLSLMVETAAFILEQVMTLQTI